MVCKNCGAPLVEHAVFCAKCGQRVVGDGSKQEAAPSSQGVASAGQAARDGGALPPPRFARGPDPIAPKRGSRARWLALVVVALIAVGAYFIVQSQNAGWHVSLKADWKSVGTGSTVHLTAVANKRVDG